ncbi:fimbrial protein [Serratia fonticola]|uniref:fimbrial protein n=1 Tax=Serratia fonticola TaxID=47917 RepID=UPI001646AE39|nr:type 1 fimbrial protein [Serratia fonticola]MBC3218629.1 type 1 fimbrial protein [Serratia fonticola]
MKRIMQRTIGLLMFMVASNSAWAVVNCTALGSGSRTDIVQLTPPAISAGADIPVGTVIYQGRWISGSTGISVMDCTSTLDPASMWLNVAWSIEQAPMPLSSWSGSPFGGAVYETGIPGIGIAISRSNNGDAAKVGQPNYQFPNDVESPITGGHYKPYMANRVIYVSLIKTGVISPGNHTLDASKLPVAGLTIVNPLYHASTAGLPITVTRVQFQGQLTVSAQTCSTPLVAVAMGEYDIGEYFNRIGSTTPWLDASIRLTNCPTFYGFYNADNSTLMFDYSTGTGLVANSTSNSIGVRLTPATSVIDAANGVMEIDSTVPGAASGVGIQLGWGESSQTPTLFNFSTEQAMTLPKDGSPTIRVPLAVRYIQTASAPTPGKANGKVVFTINYY